MADFKVTFTWTPGNHPLFEGTSFPFEQIRLHDILANATYGPFNTGEGGNADWGDASLTYNFGEMPCQGLWFVSALVPKTKIAYPSQDIWLRHGAETSPNANAGNDETEVTIHFGNWEYLYE